MPPKSTGLARSITSHILGASRSFSTTLSGRSNGTPPESPSYIRLSDPPQSEEKRLPRVRGHLPVPREIFPRLEGDRKIRPEYIHSTAPEPINRPEPTSEAQKWRYKMAETRRNNLKFGLRDLWTRRTRSDNYRQQRVASKFEENRKIAQEPEREDERLTRTTVMDAMLDTKVYPDPDRFIRADWSRSNVAARENAQREARREALVELYISASNFIVHEDQLKSEIEQMFDEEYFTRQSLAKNRYGTTRNVWGLFGKPPSISNMLDATSNTSTRVVSAYYETEHERSVSRQKKIAGFLTGGRMK